MAYRISTAGGSQEAMPMLDYAAGLVYAHSSSFTLRLNVERSDKKRL